MIKPRIQTTHHANSTTMCLIDTEGPARIEVEWISDMRVYVSVSDGVGAASVQIHKSIAKEFFRLLAGQQRTRINCDARGCIHNERGVCTLDEISIGKEYGCEHTCKELTSIDE